MSWFRVESSLRTHPKIEKLSRRLGVSFAHALGLITGLWAWVCDTAADGNLTAYDSEDLAIAARWEGDPEQFRSALVEVRLLDEIENEIHVHDWMERAEGFRRAQKEAARRETKRGARVGHGGARVPVTDGRTDREDREDGSKIPPARAREGRPDFLVELVTRWNSEAELEKVFDAESCRSQWTAIEAQLTQRQIDIRSAIETFVINAASSGIVLGREGKNRHKWPLRHLLRQDRFRDVLNGEWSTRRGADPSPEEILSQPLKGGGSGLRARAAAIRQLRQQEARAGPVIETTAKLIKQLGAGDDE